MRPLICCWHCYKDVGPPGYEFLPFLSGSTLYRYQLFDVRRQVPGWTERISLCVATCPACCRLRMNSAVAVSTSSHVLSFTAENIVSRNMVLYIAQFVVECVVEALLSGSLWLC